MLCLCGFVLYSRWVLLITEKEFLILYEEYLSEE